MSRRPMKSQVPSDSQKRGGVPPRRTGGGGGGPSFFNMRRTEDIFADDIFGFPSGGSSSRFPSGAFPEDKFSAFFGDYGGGVPSMHNHSHSVSRKANPIENRLPCSLEDLYKGTTKTMKVSREILDASGRTKAVEEILTINVKPGWKKGTKITFPMRGNEQPGIIPADLVFIIDEKPHPVFTREGNDLIVTQKISLAEALKGYTVHLTTLDGRNLTIPINNVIHPTYEKFVPREGMPNQKEASRKGNLRIKFNIKVPTRLTSDQKE